MSRNEVEWFADFNYCSRNSICDIRLGCRLHLFVPSIVRLQMNHDETLMAHLCCVFSQKTQRRSSTEQNESRFVDVGKTSTLDKIRHSDENSKTVPDSPGVSVPDLTTEDSTQNLAQNGEVKMTSRTPSKQHSNGYINGTFYQL